MSQRRPSWREYKFLSPLKHLPLDDGKQAVGLRQLHKRYAELAHYCETTKGTYGGASCGGDLNR